MNIQIFVKEKCFDCKKAERFFKERGIKFQLINISKFGMSIGEYKNIKLAAGGVGILIDKESKEYETLFIKYLAKEEDIEQKLLDNQNLFRTPIIRNGKKVSIGFCPELWLEWIKE